MPIKTIKSNTAIHGIHNAMAITLRIRNGKVFIFQCCSVRFCGLYIGYESREATGFTIPFWRRANARNVVFVTWSESDDEGLTLALLFLYGANLTLFNFFDNKFLSCTSSPTRYGTAISLQTKPWAMLTLTRLMNCTLWSQTVYLRLSGLSHPGHSCDGLSPLSGLSSGLRLSFWPNHSQDQHGSARPCI